MRRHPLAHCRIAGRQRQRQLGAVMHMGQAQHLGHIQLDRVLGDPQLTGDLVVGLTLTHLARDVELAR